MRFIKRLQYLKTNCCLKDILDILDVDILFIKVYFEIASALILPLIYLSILSGEPNTTVCWQG